jgi:hypothetical protein
MSSWRQTSGFAVGAKFTRKALVNYEPTVNHVYSSMQITLKVTLKIQYHHWKVMNLSTLASDAM